jgi:hypothetical protein
MLIILRGIKQPLRYEFEERQADLVYEHSWDLIDREPQ